METVLTILLTDTSVAVAAYQSQPRSDHSIPRPVGTECHVLTLVTNSVD